MLKQKFQQRFDELKEQYTKIQFTIDSVYSMKHAERGDWMRWATSTQNLLRTVYGEKTPHYANFTKAIENCAGYDDEVNALFGIFQSAKEDFEGGYVFDPDVRISGEVFGDFVAMSKQSLSEGYKDVAAVLACAALEDTLKRFATLNGLHVSDKSMTEVVNALKSKGLVAGAQKSLLDPMPRIRDYAMHANWEKITAPDVNSVIGFVEQFLLSNFNQD